MELIHALEQLSLEVRNKKINNRLLNDVEEIFNDYNEQRLKEYNNQNNHQYSHNHSSTGEPKHHQFEEFESSVETLFAQISDLDCIEYEHYQQSKPNFTTISAHRAAFANRLNHADSHNGSLYTSQEEDSDSSSQRSNNCQMNAQYMNPLVEDLLKRDISSITNTVRKIGQILALGNELESSYNNLFTNLSNEDLYQKHFACDAKHVQYLRSICDAFTQLCASEPHIRDLPTILRYSDYCHKLTIELNKLAAMLNIRIASLSIDDANLETNDMDSSGELYSEDVKVSLDGDENIAILDCDQRLVDKWTENKLYINQRFNN